MFKEFIEFVSEIYSSKDSISLHEPYFAGKEKKYLADVIDSTFVSSVGRYVDLFEEKLSEFTGSKYAIATVNGTSALHIALKVAGVKPGDEVITQSLTFVATCNAIRYCGATPVLLDVDKDNLCLSSIKLDEFLKKYTQIRDDGFCWNKLTGKRISAVVPMHTYGHPCDIMQIEKICHENRITLVEDAAESLGSFVDGVHTGNFGKVSAISFNGNKIITTGGGGVILTADPEIAKQARHLTTTAKRAHKWEFSHDEVAYNYRMPNINAAVGLAQMENIENILSKKRKLAEIYNEWFSRRGIKFLIERKNTKSNYWLNSIILGDKNERDAFLSCSNKSNIATRPTWTPMHMLEINKDCFSGNMKETEYIFDRLVNIPSSARYNFEKS